MSPFHLTWSHAAIAYGLGSFVLWMLGVLLQWSLGHMAARARTAVSFARAIELRVPSLAGKAEATARLAARAAERAGLGPLRAERLRLAARLADIGYAAVPYGALNGEDPTSAESAVVARHPAIGAAILELVPGASDVADLVRRHHDRDPNIPLEHRLLVAASAMVERLRGEASSLDALLIAAQAPETARAIVDAEREPVVS